MLIKTGDEIVSVKKRIYDLTRYQDRIKGRGRVWEIEPLPDKQNVIVFTEKHPKGKIYRRDDIVELEF